ncbi:hypothetical protein E1262_26895 [Jiangella aurantiaca]|uniref:Uncharacterized protein n=1 Tax=Jiangella aurantiaca TaxID=2530373 RepID=A0A4R5A5Q1_9ACTN|nr:hypothetical protein E1262_26895 [Jiangella aurantiaca]
MTRHSTWEFSVRRASRRRASRRRDHRPVRPGRGAGWWWRAGGRGRRAARVRRRRRRLAARLPATRAGVPRARRYRDKQ